MYLIVLFISPLYFLIRKKWLGFILNLILYGIAVVFLVTIIFAWVGFLFWILAVGHAGWHIKQENMEKHADMVATKMAEKMKEDKNG